MKSICSIDEINFDIKNNVYNLKKYFTFSINKEYDDLFFNSLFIEKINGYDLIGYDLIGINVLAEDSFLKKVDFNGQDFFLNDYNDIGLKEGKECNTISNLLLINNFGDVIDSKFVFSKTIVDQIFLKKEKFLYDIPFYTENFVNINNRKIVYDYKKSYSSLIKMHNSSFNNMKYIDVFDYDSYLKIFQMTFINQIVNNNINELYFLNFKKRYFEILKSIVNNKKINNKKNIKVKKL